MNDHAIEVELDGARVAFSTRVGGVSEGAYASLNLGILTGDERERVEANRERLLGALRIEQIAMGMQVHGTDLATWDGPSGELIDVDGHVTDTPGLALLVLTADCLPVALAAPGRVAMLHCGWRGIAGGIVANGVGAFDDPPIAVVGPGIGQPHFEVGAEVLEAFADVPAAADGRLLDLRAVAEARLRAAGVQDVRHVDLCTYERDDLFFSHRRDDGVTGRQAGLIWLT